jgi:fibronectin-binding autotransporter adhesin
VHLWNLLSRVAWSVSLRRSLTVLAGLAILLLAGQASAATKYWVTGSGTCTGASILFSNSNCWSLTSGVSGSAGVPGSMDTATFDSGDKTACTINVAATVNSINVLTGYNKTISITNTASNPDLTVTGAFAMDAGTATFSPGSAQVSAGSFSLTAGTFTPGSMTLTVSGATNLGRTADLSLATLALSGSLTISGQTTTLGSQTWSVASLATTGGDLTLGTSTLTVTGAGTSTTIGAGDHLNLSGSTLHVQHDMSNSGQVKLLTGTLTVDGSFSLAAGGTWFNQTTATGTLTVSGAFDIDTTANNNMDLSNLTSLTFSGAVTWNNSGNSLTLPSSASITPTSLTVTAGTLNTNGATVHPSGAMSISGTLAPHASAITVGTTFTFNSGANFTAASATGSLTVNGNSTISDTMNLGNMTGLSFANVSITAGTTTFPGAGVSPTISGTFSLSSGASFTSGALTRLTISNNITSSGTLDLSNPAALTLSGTLTVNAGTSTLGAQTLTISSVTANGGTFNAGTSTLTVSGITSLAGGNVTLAGGTTSLRDVDVTSGTFTNGSGSTTLSSTLTMTGGSLTSSTGSLTIDGAASIGGSSATVGSTFTAASGSTVRFLGAVNVGDASGNKGVFIGGNNLGAVSFEFVTSIGSPNSLIVQGANSTFSSTGATPYTFGLNAISGTNAIDLLGGTMDLSTNSPTVTISAGNVNIASGGTFKMGTVATSFASGTTWTIGGTFTGTSTKALTFGGPVTISSGGTFSGGTGARTFSSTLAVDGSYTATTGSNTFSVAVTSSGTFDLTNASALSTFGGSLSISGGTTTFPSWGAGTTLTLPSLSVSGGTLDTAANNTRVTVSGTTSVSGTGNANMASGNITRLTGGVTVSGGTLTVGASSGCAVTDPISSTLTVTGGTFATGSCTYTVAGAVAVGTSGGTITLGSGATTFSSTLGVSTGGTFTGGGGTLGVSLGVTVSGGSLTLGTNTTTMSSTVTVSSGTFTASSGTFNVTSAGVTVSGGTMTLAGGTTGFSSTLDVSGGTFNAGSGSPTVTGAATVTSSGTLNAGSGNLIFSSTLTLGNATPTSGTFNSGTATVHFNGAVVVQRGSTFNDTAVTNAGTLTFALTTGVLTASAFNSGGATITFTGIFTLDGSSNFNGRTGTTTFTAAPTLTSGTFTVGSAASAGSVILSAGATFGSGTTLAFPTSGSTLSMPGGQTLTISGGTVTSSAGTAATKPKISQSSLTTGITVTVSSGTLNVDGLEIDNLVAGGMSIASGVTYTKLAHLKFQNNVAAGAAGSRYLLITLGTAVINVPGCYFDNQAAANVKLQGTSGLGRGAHAIFEYQSSGTNGAGAGESLDDDGDILTPIDNYGDDTTTSPYYGSVVEWVYASPADTTGTALGPPVTAFDWNTFATYGVYVSFKNTGGAGTADRLWMRNADGSAAYWYDVPDSSGDIVGIPRFDTVNETTAGVDANGDNDTADSDVHVVYIGTSTGHVIKLIDDGTQLIAPGTFSVWHTDFTDSTNVTSITSPLISDGTNLYFGGTTNPGAVPKIFGVQIASGVGTEKTLQKNITATGTGAITSAPAWTIYNGATYLIIGSAAVASQAYVYEVQVSPGATIPTSYSAPTTSITAAINLINNRAYAVTAGGKLYAIDASISGTFTALTGFPYQNSPASALTTAVFVDPSMNYAYFGDSAGRVFIVQNTGATFTTTNATAYPFQVAGASAVMGTPYYRRASGTIAVAADDGYVYFVNRQDASGTPQVRKRYFVGAGGVSTVSYNSGAAEYMVATSDGHMTYITNADVGNDIDGNE